MEQVLMMKGASRLMDVCARVKEGEKVLIVTDFPKVPIAEVLAAAAYERGADVVVTVMTPRELDGAEPPGHVAAAMKAADVIFTPVTHSITHSNATKEAIMAGARGIMLSAFIPDQLISGGIDGDFEGIRPMCLKVAELLTNANVAHLTTPAGTDITMRLDGRPGNPHTGLAHNSGDFTTVPNIESSVSPIEGSVEGVIIADASIPYYNVGVLREPVRYEVTGGRIVKITGGAQAQQIADLMASCNHEAVYNIAQLAFGLNPKCKMRGVMLDDEGVYGTAHIGIGTSTLLGGVIKAPGHYDAIMWLPTLTLDGKIVLKDGEWQLPEAVRIDK
jgi:2,5-dihydroxypyridine 5,6-dioxygenase